MAFIVETFAGDRRVQLGYETFSRKMGFGNNWNKIRIGWRWSVNDPLVNLLAPIRFCAGVGSDTTPFSSYNLVDFVGVLFGASTYTAGATFTRVTNTGVVAFSAGNSVAIRKQADIVTLGTSSGNSTGYVSGQPSLHRSVGFVTIARVGTAHTITGSMSSTAPDVSRTAYLAIMEDEANTPAGMANMGIGLTITAGLDCDSVNISWNKSIPTVEFSDVTVVRYY